MLAPLSFEPYCTSRLYPRAFLSVTYPSPTLETYHFCESVPLPDLISTLVPSAPLLPATVRYFCEFVFLMKYQPLLIEAAETEAFEPPCWLPLLLCEPPTLYPASLYA